MNIEELQKAIAILYNPAGVSPEVTQQAQLFCNEFAQTNAARLADFFVFLVQTDNQATRFWLLQAIVDIITNVYNQIFPSKEQRVALHQLYFQILREKPHIVFMQKHYVVKYALIFVLLVKEDFPELWPNAFQELLSLVKQVEDVNIQKQYMGLIVKIMLLIEEELVERQELKSPQALERQNKVKDGIRQNSINDIVFIIMQLLQSHEVFDQELVNEGLEITAQLIDWNALELFAPYLDLFKQFLKADKFRTNALSCLHSFVHKGMDYPAKVELIVNINFLDILESFQPKFRDRPTASQDNDLDLQEEQEQEEEFFAELSEIVDKLGQWCLELFQNEEKLLPTREHQQQFEIIYARTLKLAIELLDTDKPKIGRNCLEFISFWIQAIKKSNESQALSDFQLQCLAQLAFVLFKRLKYPDWCTFDEQNSLSEHEEDYIAYREELSSLIPNLALMKSFHQQFLNSIGQLFVNVVPGQTNFAQAEVPLYIAYHIYQAIPHQQKESRDNEYYELMLYLFKVDFLHYDHKIVCLMYLEDLVRYSSYFVQEQAFINNIVSVFFSSKAIMSNEPQLASRSCYLLLRLCEKMPLQLVNQAQAIVDSTIQVIAKVETGQHQDHLITYDDLLFLYNVIGLFASNKKIDHEYRRKIVVQVMDSLIQRLNQCQPIEKDKITWILKFLNVFTKGFQSEISAFMKENFAKVLQQVLSILPNNMNNSLICDQVLQYLQKNVVLLGNDVKPFILMIALPYIQSIEFERLEMFLTIMNYSMTVLKSDGIELIDSMLIALMAKMSAVKIPSSDLSDIEKNNIRIFQSFFKLVQSSAEINAAFLVSPSNLQYFEEFVKYLTAHFEQNVDKATKRSIANSFKEILIQFSGLSHNPQALQILNKKQKPGEINTSNSVVAAQYPQVYQFFLEQILWLSIRIIFILYPQNLEDLQIAKVLAEIHAVFVLSGYTEQLFNGLKQASNEQIATMIIQQCEGFAQKQQNKQSFLDNYLKILVSVRQG